VTHNKDEIEDALRTQIKHGSYPTEPVYGDGTAGVKIADVLAGCSWRIQKRIVY